MEFREIRRINQKLSEEACIEVLKNSPRGVLSVLGDGDYPYGMPLDFFYDKETGTLLFHCALNGHKLDAIQKHDTVSFNVIDSGYHKDGDWALTFHSVILFGRMHVVTEEERRLYALRAIGRKYFPDKASVEGSVQRSINRVTILELTVDHMSGKRVTEK